MASLALCLPNGDVSHDFIFLVAGMEYPKKQLEKEQFILAQGLRVQFTIVGSHSGSSKRQLDRYVVARALLVTVAAVGGSWIHCS